MGQCRIETQGVLWKGIVVTLTKNLKINEEPSTKKMAFLFCQFRTLLFTVYDYF